MTTVETLTLPPVRPQAAPASPAPRPRVLGPSILLGEEKLVVRGVTYGTFAPRPDGWRFPDRETIRRDFEAMRLAGINTVRTYTAPSDAVLEEARRAGLRVLVGVHYDARDCLFHRRSLWRQAEAAVRDVVRRCRLYPDVVLAYVVGNEVPPLTVRFHGRRRIERFLHHLYRVAKEEDPEGLVTYGNYPSTEFLQVEFFDLYTLNVYLLQPHTLSRYLDRMMIQAKGKPLLIGEIGDDTLRSGEEAQARLLDWTIPLVLDKGVAGLCVFAWTDEWHVGEHDVRDWAFGLVDRERRPKPALETVRRRYLESPFARRHGPWPRVSVVVCNYNGAETLDETLTSLERLDYPDYEILLVEDGSTDESPRIGERHAPRVRMIRQENRGLSVARNVGLAEATGTIVAYIDSDAFADRDWLRHLVIAMESGPFVGAGGPNLTPASDGLTAQFIALCPGNPTHVLRDDVRAEHLAGVNMAFRRDALLSIGGFDPVHRRAGDDVDICWRLEDARMELAFSPAAIVWHHRRPSIRRYLKQQGGYGEAENQLVHKHPERFNLGGYIRWKGRIYLAAHRVTRFSRPFVYHGRFGVAPFQSLYQKDPSIFADLPRTVQWYLVAAFHVLLTPISLWFLFAAGLMFAASAWFAFEEAISVQVPFPLTRRQAWRKVWVIGSMNFLHPVVRWWGRVKAAWKTTHPLAPLHRLHWMRPRFSLREAVHFVRSGPQTRRYWGVGAGPREALLRRLQADLKGRRVAAVLGEDWDSYDLELGGTIWAAGRLTTATEQYDKAMVVGLWVRSTGFGKAVLLLLAAGAAAATVWVHPFLVVTAAIPALLGTHLLGQRARLRRSTWDAVHETLTQAGGKPYDDPREKA
jgi:glycosyltransferase involved in cell wall biosynthesis